MYTIMNLEELKSLKHRLDNYIFSNPVSDLQFNVQVVDVKGNILPFNKACETLSELLGIHLNYDVNCDYIYYYPCFHTSTFTDTTNNVRKGGNPMYIISTIIVSNYEPLIKLP